MLHSRPRRRTPGTAAVPARRSRARVVRIKGAGHWVHAEKPEVFSALLRSFFTAT